MQLIVFIVGLIRGAVITALSVLGIVFGHWFVFLPLIVFLIFVPRLFRGIRAFLARCGFVRRVKLAARRNGGRVTLGKGRRELYLKLKNRSYVLKLFPYSNSDLKVYIHDTDSAYISRARAQTITGKWKGRVNFIFNRAESKMKKRPLRMPECDGGICVLVFAPSPYELYVHDQNGYRITGSGECFEGVLLYEGNDFINFIERQ